MALTDSPADSADDPQIRLEGVSKQYDAPDGSVQALSSASMTVDQGEFCCVVGPSGCGKTTLLRLIAGLEAPTAGQVLVDGDPVTGPGQDRGMVFQEYALFPWRTVRGNVRFGLERPACECADCEARVDTLLDLVGLTAFGDHYPADLSGGMKQRVGIARALAVKPEMLLMDEPFASVDARTRDGLHDELLDIWRATDQTVVFVTHDIDEAVTLADRIVVMDTGETIRATISVTCQRPRDRTSESFVDYVAQLRAELGE